MSVKNIYSITFHLNLSNWLVIYNFQYFSILNLHSFLKFIYNIKRKLIQIINTNDLIVEASGKKICDHAGI
jgi:hypothetical protein